MLISNAVERALEEIAVREHDVLQAYAPGAMPRKSDVAQRPRASFTANPLSVAPPAQSYFVVAGEQGRQLFTRDGTFALRDGALVDEQGHAVLGYASEVAPLAPLRADAVDAALGYTRSARIEADGTVCYERTTVDPRTGLREPQRATLGRLALARFAAGSKLVPFDAQRVTAPEGIAPHLGRAADRNFGALTPNARESSGIDIDRGLQRLQEAYIALDAIRAAGKAQGSLEKTAMDLLK